MARIVVLGCGLVGSVIALDLAADPALNVVCVDADAHALQQLARRTDRITTVQADLREPCELHKIIRDAALVVGAVPGHLGYRVLQGAIEQRKPVVDISFMPQDPRSLHERAREAGVAVWVDFGVAPGMSNVLAAYAASKLDIANKVRIYVGGLPQVRRLPYEYAAVFSPADVIEEYTRPARFVQGGQLVERPALSDVELIDVPGIGTLEAFNTDGLRSLMWSLKVPDMREKTLRYPGHADRIRLLADTGLLSQQPVHVADTAVRPVDLTLQLLRRAWQLPPGEGDVTVMRVQAEGIKDGHLQTHVFELLDRYDPATKMTSMARTTAFPCASAARLMLASPNALTPGVHFPEEIVEQPALLTSLFEQLASRGVSFEHRVTDAAGPDS